MYLAIISYIDTELEDGYCEDCYPATEILVYNEYEHASRYFEDKDGICLERGEKYIKKDGKWIFTYEIVAL